jgi:hypothetical protein
VAVQVAQPLIDTCTRPALDAMDDSLRFQRIPGTPIATLKLPCSNVLLYSPPW